MKRRRLLVAAVAVILVIGGFAAAPWVRVYMGSAPPDQFYRPLTPAPVAPDRHVLLAAHNAGNNQLTANRALAYRADVIEIDVTMARGVLVAGRAHEVPWLAERVFRGSTLAQAWEFSDGAPIIKLDLQRNDRPLLSALASFLRANAGRDVMVSTRDADAISYLRPRVPAAVRLLFTAAFPDAVRVVQSDPGLVEQIAGISVFHGLVSRSLVGWAHARGLLVMSWTVNDADRLNPLLDLGVDGITTANLAIIEALSR